MRALADRERTMDKAEIAALVRAAYAARLAGDVPLMLSYFADDARFSRHAQALAAPDAPPIRGHEAIAAAFRALVGAYTLSDWRDISLVVDGDRAALHWRATVTVARTEATETFDVFDFIRFRGDKIDELDQSTDTAKLLAVSGFGS
jgi:ketosteroid isomerase-like protein